MTCLNVTLGASTPLLLIVQVKALVELTFPLPCAALPVIARSVVTPVFEGGGGGSTVVTLALLLTKRSACLVSSAYGGGVGDGLVLHLHQHVDPRHAARSQSAHAAGHGKYTRASAGARSLVRLP